MIDLRLYMVVGAMAHLPAVVEGAIAGGVTLLQLRFKERTDREVIELARPAIARCAAANVPVIINDRIDLALILGAQGVHLGVDDLPLADARNLAPPGFEIGCSPETDDQIADAAELGATYLGIGPFYRTATKGDAGEPLGPEEFARRRSLTPLPVVGIGGITAANAPAVIAAGADGVAVSSAITAASDPARAARAIRESIGQ